ncbi:MAG: hypothetical protein ACOYO1_00405 [Bacteroidales bacterium]
MKNKILKLVIIIFIILLPAFTQSIYSQPPPYPPWQHGNSGNGGWEGAPLDGGVVFILLTAVAYAGRKIYFLRKKVN